ncbi:MAG: bacillithiol system redox-active protein YtxJ [Planctomycetaceae bacterium]|nr:bacillithiol system redox-active protein YtxJ [Planctomycetaceae bacterium]
MIDLSSLLELEAVLKPSKDPVVLYKHSTQCGMCDGAIEEVQAFEEQKPAEVRVYYLDLLAHRDVSNAIAQKLGVRHESPQAIVLKEGKPVAVFNHRQVKAEALRSATQSASQKW